MKRRHTVLATLVVFIIFLLSPSVNCLTGDLNGDLKVGVEDVIIVLEAFASYPGHSRWNPMADVDGDGVVGISDVIAVAENFGAIAQNPVAAFTESTHLAPAGTSIEFNPSESYDPDGIIVLYEWDWESDGVYDHSSTDPEVVSHQYLTPGTYDVTLRVTDDDGLTDTASAEKTITPAFNVPEIPLGTLLASAAMIIALLAYFAKPKWKKPATPNTI